MRCVSRRRRRVRRRPGGSIRIRRRALGRGGDAVALASAVAVGAGAAEGFGLGVAAAALVGDGALAARLATLVIRQPTTPARTRPTTIAAAGSARERLGSSMLTRDAPGCATPPTDGTDGGAMRGELPSPTDSPSAEARRFESIAKSGELDSMPPSTSARALSVVFASRSTHSPTSLVDAMPVAALERERHLARRRVATRRARRRAPCAITASNATGTLGHELLGGSHLSAIIARPSVSSSSAAAKSRSPGERLPRDDRRGVDVGLARDRRPLSCSGAMYASLPLSWPSRVVWTRPAALATPKSSTRAMPSTPTRTFCGETSRCTMLERLAALVLAPRAPRAGRGARRR